MRKIKKNLKKSKKIKKNFRNKEGVKKMDFIKIKIKLGRKKKSKLIKIYENWKIYDLIRIKLIYVISYG